MGFGGFHVLNKAAGIFEHTTGSLHSEDFGGRADAGRWGKHLPISQHLGRLIPGCLGHAATTHFGEGASPKPHSLLPLRPREPQMEQQKETTRLLLEQSRL